MLVRLVQSRLHQTRLHQTLLSLLRTVRLQGFTTATARALLILLIVAVCIALTSASASAITLMQRAAIDSAATTTSSLPFTTNNTAGNWIGVCIRAGRTGEAFTVRDSRGNVYRRAAQLNVTVDSPNGDTVAIFYAENVAAGANTVTVSDSLQATLRVAIFEYSGLATANSLDVSAGAQGTGTALNTGSVTSTVNGDLVLSALMTADPRTFTAGAGFASQAFVPAEPNTKLIAEDRVQTSAGALSATASINSADPWGAVVATFKSSGVNTVSSAPHISQLTPASGPVGQSVTIAGSNFGATQSTSTVKFNGTVATPTSWSATRVVAPVPAGATSGSVVVTVSGVASNGVTFTVGTSDTTPPSVTVTSPANSATVSGSVTLQANASDNVGVKSVQFRLDGANLGSPLTTAPYSSSWNTAATANGSHTISAVATDAAGNQGSSAVVTVTVSNAVNTSMGPLKHSTVNTRYFINPAGHAVFLAGSHSWDDFQDTDTSGSTPAAFNFTAFVSFMKQHGQNATILWRKDLPEYCNWNVSGSVWKMGPLPWLRPGPGVASDSGPKFDLTQLNQAYFDRLRSRVQQLQQNGMYAIVQLFDANQLTFSRCSTDGYPFTGTNNINGVDDGYTSGASGANSVTMTAANAISGYQDTYVKKVLDTLNDLPNVIYEVSEEQPTGSANWWFPHVISLVRSYEATKPLQHPVGIGAMTATAPNDGTLYSSAADWIAPTINSNFSNQFPSNVSTNNQGKVVINDADHAYFWKTFTNSDGSLKSTQMHNYLWENIASGAEGVVLMDPYVVYWPSSPNRNLCLSPLHQICTGGVDTKFDGFRSAMGYAQSFVNSHLNLLKMTPQGGLSSTGFCLADNSATGAEYLVYAPSGGSFTVNLSATARAMNVLWLNPATGATVTATGITGGKTQSFTAPFSGDAVLYIVDAAGHN
jgi:hypothetical protein